MIKIEREQRIRLDKERDGSDRRDRLETNR